jgi:hypothetical protein
MYGIFRTLHDMFRGLLHMYPRSHCHLHCVMYSRSMQSLCCLRNDKQQLVPKNPKFAKKAKICQKSLILAKKNYGKF